MCPQGVTILQDNHIPVYRFPENAAQALGALYRRAKWLNRQHLAQFTLTHDRERAADIIHTSLAQGRTYLGAMEAEELLHCYGFHVLPAALAKTEDVVFRIAPIDRNNANQMIKGIKGLPILEGFRGRPRADIETLQRLLVSLSDMVLNHPEIKEMDINPLFVHAEGEEATVADVRIILGEPDPECTLKNG